MACSMVWLGNSCRVIATSPKARSKSTRHTCRLPLSVNARARLTAMVVLPTPPLGENTEITVPWCSAAAGPRRAIENWWARVTAPAMLSRSLSATTSRAPACMARASVWVSKFSRTSTTPVMGRLTRRPSQTRTASSKRTFGPSTTTYSSGCWDNHGSNRSVESTDWHPGGSAPRSLRTLPLSGSTMTGMTTFRVGKLSLERQHVVAVGGGGLGDLAVLGEQREGHVVDLRGQDDLLGLLLVERQREQRPGELFGLLRAVLGGRRRGHRRGAAHPEHRDPAQEELGTAQVRRGGGAAGSALAGGVVGRAHEDGHLGSRADEAGHPVGV